MNGQIKSIIEHKHYIDWLRVLAFGFFFLYTSTSLFSQSKRSIKTLNITRIDKKTPKIDGFLTDEAWKGLEIANDFIMFKPNNGEKENSDGSRSKRRIVT